MNLEYRINFAEEFARNERGEQFHARVAEILGHRDDASLEDLAAAINQTALELEGPDDLRVIPMEEMP